MNPPADGAVVVDKPPGLTSHDVVARVRRLLGVKAGHTGTLDPLATGVLPVLVGKATRLARFYSGDEKVYEAAIRLGQTTESFDRGTPVTERRPVPRIDDALARRTLAEFVGEQSQMPPMYSAVKVAGQPLYKAARRGESVERKPRRIVVFSLQLLERQEDLWTVRVHCSSGTYIRSLAHDLGRKLGCGAHLDSLRRIRSGPFELSKSVTLETLAELGRSAIEPIEELLPQFPALHLDPEQSRRISHGNPIPITIAGDVFRLYSEGRLLALAERREGTAAPIAVFEPA